MRIGSLFSGYGGLDMAVQSVFGGDIAWVSEIDPAACKVLNAHMPSVVNIGDVTKVCWDDVEQVDILTGGYPCQPFSHAGKRKGKDDERHLWPYVRDAIGALRPRVVVLENVRGHLTLGFADVVGDLASLGYDCRWGVVRAADAGACHGRARLFIVAYPYGEGLQGFGGEAGAAQAGRHGYVESGIVGPAPDTANLGHQWTGSARDGGPGSSYCGVSPADADRHGYGIELHARGMGSLEAAAENQPSERQWPRREPVPRGDFAAADAPSARTGAHGSVSGQAGQPRGSRQPAVLPPADWATSADRTAASGGTDWGKYALAIRRWEFVTRPAPAPTIPGSSGRPRLSPVFVEWLMGLPEGHVTGHGLSNAQCLKMLGNGVVPQQAALALRLILPVRASLHAGQDRE